MICQLVCLCGRDPPSNAWMYPRWLFHCCRCPLVQFQWLFNSEMVQEVLSLNHLDAVILNRAASLGNLCRAL